MLFHSMLYHSLHLCLDISDLNFIFAHMHRAVIHCPMRIYKPGWNLITPKQERCLNICTGGGICSNYAICHCYVTEFRSMSDTCMQGIWRAAIYNPMRIYKLGYSLTTTKEGRCLNNCTGHGTCSNDAVCHCHDNWTGGDCSVHANSCEPGSRKAMPM